MVASAARAVQTVGVVFALMGCGHTRAPLPSKVAVLPFDGLGLPEKGVEKIRKELARQVARAGVTVLPADHVARALQAVDGCTKPSRENWAVCGPRVGSKLKASHVIVGAAGGLGSTYVLQLQLIGVKRKALTRAVEETVIGKPDALKTVLPRVTVRLLDLPRPTRWYERWWLWSLVGVAVATAVAVPLALQEPEGVPVYRTP